MTSPDNTDVSVIVRFGNEETYLGATLRAVRAQVGIDGVEIIAVDNESTDGSRAIAAEYASQLLTIGDYRPGRALNIAIANSTGRFVVVLSAHAIPSDTSWLSRLREAVDHPNCAGAYGAQVYNCHSRFLSKQTLDVFSTMEPRIERVDSDFWNANSIFRRSIWQQTPFDESVCELEDHFWTKQLLPSALHVRFEPQALVYHYTHIRRLDRQILPTEPKTEKEFLEEATADLSSLDIAWPRAMTAGMIANSLPATHLGQELIAALGQHLLHNVDFDVRWRMAQALGKIESAVAAQFLVAALDDGSLYPRTEAAWSLSQLGEVGVAQFLINLPSLSPRARLFGALALASSGVSRGERVGVEIVMEGLRDRNPAVRLQSAYVAGEISQARDAALLIPELNGLLTSSDLDEVRVGCWALGCYAPVAESIDWPSVELQARHHEDPLVRYEAVVALGKRSRATLEVTHAELLQAFLSDSASRVRYGAVQSLRLLSETGHRVRIADTFADDEDFGVRFEGRLLGGASPWIT